MALPLIKVALDLEDGYCKHPGAQSSLQEWMATSKRLALSSHGGFKTLDVSERDASLRSSRGKSEKHTNVGERSTLAGRSKGAADLLPVACRVCFARRIASRG
jgi:hypothetical protein